MSALSRVVAQETQDGRLIVRFLAAAMNGQLADFQPCHRLDAARLLVKLGFDPAQPSPPLVSLPNHRTAQSARRRQSRAQLQTQRESESQSAANRVRSELAQIVREETDDGYMAVRFLVNVMQGELPDFKPCHRLSAARELLQRGFDCAPDEPDLYDEDRLHDCNGDPLTPQRLEEVAHHPPAKADFIDHRDGAVTEAFKARYAEYVNRRNALNPDHPIDFNLIRWPRYWCPPGPEP